MLKTRPGDLVMPDPFEWFFSQYLDYFRPYKNQGKPDYKGYPIESMVIFLDHLGQFGNIEENLGPYWTFWDHFYPLGINGIKGIKGIKGINGWFHKQHFSHPWCFSGFTYEPLYQFSSLDLKITPYIGQINFWKYNEQ